MDWDVWKAFLRIIICLPIVVILIYLVIKYGLGKTYNHRAGNLKVVEQIFLNPKTTINIIKVADDYYLIGSSEKDVRLLKKLDDYQEQEVANVQYKFSDYLKNLTGRNAKNE